MKKLVLTLVLAVGSIWGQTTIEQVDNTGASSIKPGEAINVTTPLDVTFSSPTHSIYGWLVYNPATTVCFVEVFNTAAVNVTLGTTAPQIIIPVKNNTIDTHSFILPLKDFSGGLSVASVTSPGGSTVCTSGALVTLFLSN